MPLTAPLEKWSISMPSRMARVVLLTAAFPALNCNTGGYVIEQSVTVPPDVQRVFSASGPGFVMSIDTILGVLCAPRSESVTFHRDLFYRYSTCVEEQENAYVLGGTAYAVRPTESELQRLDARTRGILACGETTPVEDKSARTDVYLLNYHDNLLPERLLAVGSSKGECVSSSRYVVNITLALK